MFSIISSRMVMRFHEFTGGIVIPAFIFQSSLIYIQVGAFYCLSIILNLVFFVNLKKVSIEIIFCKPIWFTAISPPEIKGFCFFCISMRTVVIIKIFLNVPWLVTEAFSLICCPDNVVFAVYNHWETWVWHHKWIRRCTTTSSVAWPDQFIIICFSKW